MKKKILISIFLFSLAGTALAYNLLQPLPGVGQTVETFPDYITKIIPFILGLAALLAVVMIVIGGIEYAVTEAIDAKADAKDRITQAILGLLLALTSWLILNTINPALVNLQLSIPGLPGTQQTGPDPINLPCTGQSECAPGFCDILSGQSVGMCKLSAGTCQKPADCQSGTCNIPSGSKIGACTKTDVVPPPSAKVESACLSSAGIILSPTTNACDSADCGKRGGSCSKFITLPPMSQIEKKAIVVPGNFPPDKEQKLQSAIDSVYNMLPDSYRSLQKPTLVLNSQNLADITTESSSGIEASSGRSFSAATDLVVQATIVNGEYIDKSNFSALLGDSRFKETAFEDTLVHELAHAFAAEKFGTYDGNPEWVALYTSSQKENKGFALPLLKDEGGIKPYAAKNPAEDLAMTTQAYVFTNGQYKTGDARTDAILAQKFTWLEKTDLLKK